MTSHPTDRRMAALRARMKATGTELLALSPGPHMDWLLGFHPHPDERPCLLLITDAAAAWLMPALNAEGMREKTDLPFHPWSDADGPDAALAAALGAVGAADARHVALDEAMRADFALLLLDALPGARHSFTAPTLGALRMVKDDAEIAALRDSAALADAAMQALLAAARPGISEAALAEVARSHFIDAGAAPSFWIVGAGGNGAFPHHQAGQRLLERGDAVVVDIGAVKDGFPSDITRMFAVGTPPEGYAEVHAVAEAAVQAAMQAARPGVRARDVDAAARGVIADAGYGQYFVHRTGHGIGIEGHEPPWITSTSDTVLEEGMTFSIEPGIYLPGRFGIRLEEIVVLRADGPEVLSSLPRDLVVVDG